MGKVNVKQFIAQFIGLFLLFSLALFLPAGTIAWPAGWTFLILFFGFFLGVNLWLFKNNPGLVQERMQFGSPDQKGWDRVVFSALLLLPFIWLVFMSLDAVRFHWSSLPLWLQLLGGLLLLFSFYLFFLTFRENSYLSTVVRIQKDRGHVVISSGPYHYVRHPMYSGMLAFFVSTPLLLGSAYGVLFGLLIVLLVARRAVLEERTLRSELDGYAAYMSQVKYRFIPHIW
ncbi:MAG: isoprenylcysteine carboxylmethyltransferase family protein [Anaerolineaceae bacterium]|nr:isoprenylcysteine carboxylmethyltransferase family protein [Anaerolineaceae bacterium]